MLQTWPKYNKTIQRKQEAGKESGSGGVNFLNLS